MTKIIGTLPLDVDFCDDEVCYQLEVDKDRLDYMKKLSDRVKELGVYEVTLFDYRVDAYEGTMYYTHASEAEEKIKELADKPQRLDCVILHVSEDKFRYTGYLKHTNIHFSTGFIYFKEIEEKYPSVSLFLSKKASHSSLA